MHFSLSWLTAGAKYFLNCCVLWDRYAEKELQGKLVSKYIYILVLWGKRTQAQQSYIFSLNNLKSL